MLDSILIVAGETARRFRFGIAIDPDYPMQSAVDALTPAVVVQTTSGPPPAGQSGWFFHLDSKNVQVLQILPLRPLDPDENSVSSVADAAGGAASERGFGFTLRLYETEGRHRALQIHCFRTPTSPDNAISAAARLPRSKSSTTRYSWK